MDYKAEFIRIFSENVSRPGAQQLLDWLATTDFYTAPASTRFHGACECGLVMHSSPMIRPPTPRMAMVAALSGSPFLFLEK